MLTEILKLYSHSQIVETLQEFLTSERIEGIETVLSKRLNTVQVALEAPYDIHNGLAVVRTAEAMGVSRIHFIKALMKKGQGKNTTKGTLKWIHLKRHESFSSFEKERGEGLLVGACADGTVSLEQLPVDRPLCFLFGNEKEGLSDEAKKRCDRLFSVPMYGMVESLNLSVAAAISIYDYVQRKRGAMGALGDLSQEEVLEEKAHFYVRSLGVEQAYEILKRRLQ